MHAIISQIRTLHHALTNTAMAILCVGLFACATKIEHSTDSQELKQLSDSVTAALTLSDISPTPAAFHPATLASASGPRLFSVRSPLMYLENQQFTVTVEQILSMPQLVVQGLGFYKLQLTITNFLLELTAIRITCSLDLF